MEDMSKRMGLLSGNAGLGVIGVETVTEARSQTGG